ncbi:MAG TPA: polysaccharide pyruvyl transferase family protein [Hyphomicrobium sp.]
MKRRRRAPKAGTAGSEPVRRGPRVGLFGLFGSGNFGNDASLEAMVGLVRRACPDAHLVCFCDGPERVRRMLSIDVVPMSLLDLRHAGRFARRLLRVLGAGPSLVRAMAQTRRLDALIIPGTGILDDFCSGPLGVPLDVFVWCLAARLTRTPIWFASIGAGPILHPLSRWLMVAAAKLAQYRSYRDASSKSFLSRAGVDTFGDLVFPDLAFDLPRPDANARPPEEPLTVGVGVMEYWGWRDSADFSSAIHGSYQDRLSRFCVWLLERGYRVRLLPGDDMDHRAIRALRVLLEVRLSDPSLVHNVIAEPAHDLADVMTQMARTDVIVATRYHSLVCALKMGKPTLSLSYAEKNAALLEDAGLDRYVEHVEGFEVERLKGRFEELVAERATLAQSIAAFGALTKKRLQHQEELLRARLRGIGTGEDNSGPAGRPVTMIGSPRSRGEHRI